MFYRLRVTRWVLAGLLIMMLLGSPYVGQLRVADAKPFKVGAMVWNTTIPFYSNFLKGLKDAAKKYEIDLLIRNGQGKLETEVDVIKQFIVQKVDFIIVTPSDAEGIVPVIKQAIAANIPVIAANNKVGKGARVLTYVGADDYLFGRRQAELLVQTIGKSGKIGYLMGHLGTSPQILRKKGLMDYLKDYPGIKILTSVSEDWDNSKALAATQDILARYPKGSIDAIVVQGPEGVTGAEYAAQSGRTDVKFILGDYPASVRRAIRKGIVYGTINQDPYPQGFLAVEFAYFWLAKQKVRLITPNAYLYLPIITKENVDQYPAAWGG